MQKIKLFSDTPCDIPLDIAKANGIEILSIPIVVDEQSYLEGIDFDAKEFYSILENAKSLPVTSHITALTFYDKFEEAYNQGYTHAIMVTINSKGSATFDAAMVAKKNFYEDKPELKDKFDIVVMDSGTYTLGYGYPLLKAAELIASGSPVADVISYLDDTLSRIELVFTIFTLEYARKSGRIKTAAAFVGDLLGFKPIMQMRNGEIITIGKVRGNVPAMNEVIKQISERRDPENDSYLVVGGVDDNINDEFKKMCKKSLGKNNLGFYNIGPSIAINSGPKLVGVMYYAKEPVNQLKHHLLNEEQ